MATKSLSSHGTVAYWGITPALDLLAEQQNTTHVKELNSSQSTDVSSKKPINVLICAAADCRHIIKTLAERCRDPEAAQQDIHFYILNPLPENTARDILLLSTLFEDITRAKSETFLDLYGNLRIRDQTQAYLKQACQELTKWVANDPATKVFASNQFDISHLKYRERDELELIFRRWAEPVPETINLAKCWENRLRRDLERRYDHRIGAFDWDFSMNLCELGATVITATKYFRWRESGMAFEARDESAYIHQNPTLVSKFSVFTKDSSYSLQGFWGDMLTSPYIAFGTGSDAARYRKLCNNIDTISAAEISEALITDFLGKIDKSERICECDGDGNTAPPKYKFVFLSPGSFGKLCEKSKYHGLFDVIYIGGRATVESTGAVATVLAPTGMVHFESPRFLIGLKKDRCTKYYEHIHPKMLQSGFQALRSYDEKPDDVFSYARNPTTAQNDVKNAEEAVVAE